VEVADRDRERVGGVEGDAAALARQERQNHRTDLLFFGVSVADERLLHEPRLVLEDGNERAARGGEEHASSVRQLHRGGDVLRGEYRFDGDGSRPALVDQTRRSREEEVELFRERERRGRPQHAAAFEDETPRVEDHHAPSRRHAAGIEAEDLHEPSAD